MKRTSIKLVIFIVSVVAIIGCNEVKQDIEQELVLRNVEELASSSAVTPEGGEFILEIYASQPWSVEVDNAVTDWLGISPTGGEAGEGYIVVSTEPNLSVESRSASVRISCGDLQETFDVIQNGIQEDGSYFVITPTLFYLPSSESEFSVSISTNTDYTIEIANPEWITLESEEGIKEGELLFKVTENTDEIERIGIVKFMAGTETYDVKVFQEAYSGDSSTGVAYYHRSLAMRFTGDWCGYCPNMAEGFKLAQVLAPDKIEVVNFHDYRSGLAFSPTEDLKSQYQVTGVPRGIVDGRTSIRNDDKYTIAYNVTDAMWSTESNYPTVSGISFTSSISGRTLSADVTLHLKAAGDYMVTVLVLEDGIVGYQNNYYGAVYYDYVHDGIARIALSDMPGDSFSAESGNVTKTFSYSAEIPSNYNIDNLRILVYVHRAYGSQPVISSGDYGDYYIDNSVSGKAGENLDLVTVD